MRKPPSTNDRKHATSALAASTGAARHRSAHAAAGRSYSVSRVLPWALCFPGRSLSWARDAPTRSTA